MQSAEEQFIVSPLLFIHHLKLVEEIITIPRVHFTLVQNMLVMVPGEMWGFKGRIFGAGTM